jgi:hypothetical protein
LRLNLSRLFSIGVAPTPYEHKDYADGRKEYETGQENHWDKHSVAAEEKRNEQQEPKGNHKAKNDNRASYNGFLDWMTGQHLRLLP